MEILDIKERIEHKIQRGYDFNLEGYLSKGWELFKKGAGPFIIYALIIGAIQLILAFIPILGGLVSIVIMPPLTAGYFLACRKVDLGENLDLNDFFKSFDQLGPLILLSIVSGILLIIGFLLLIIPGIWFGIGITFIYPLILFTRADFWRSIELSVKIVNKKWFHFFALILVIIVINFVGLLALGIGLLITVPLTYCITYAAYSHIVGFGESAPSIEEHLVGDTY